MSFVEEIVLVDPPATVEWDTSISPEQKDSLRSVRDSLLFAINNVSEGRTDDAIADMTFAYSKINELLNRS